MWLAGTSAEGLENNPRAWETDPSNLQPIANLSYEFGGKAAWKIADGDHTEWMVISQGISILEKEIITFWMCRTELSW